MFWATIYKDSDRFVHPLVNPLVNPAWSLLVSPFVSPIVSPFVNPFVNPFEGPFVSPFCETHGHRHTTAVMHWSPFALENNCDFLKRFRKSPY